MCPEPEQLRPALDRAQHQLDARLAEACRQHTSAESTGELIKLEEMLTDAADAAKEAISIRRRLGAERDRDVDPTPPAQGSDPGPAAGVRNFVDGEGRAWHVWEVAPEQLTARLRPGTYAGDYQSGWLAFESDEGDERRRLPGYPRDWREFGAPEIEALCRDARPVTRRPRRNQDLESRGDRGESNRE